MSFRYNLPYSVTLGPQRHSFFDYPPIPIKPIESMGSISFTTGSSYADKAITWGFWIGMGLVAHRLYRVLRYDDPFFQFGGGVPAAWEMNPYTRRTFQRRQWEKLADEEKEKRKKALFDVYEPATNLSALARKLDIPVSIARRWLIESGKYIPAPMGGPRTITAVQEAKELKSRIEKLKGQKKREAFARFAIARSGENVHDLADEFGISRRTAYDWLFKEGVDIVTPGKIGKRQKGKWWKETLSPEERETVKIAVELYEEDPNRSFSVLAKQLNVTTSTLRRWLRLEGVY